MAWKKNSPGCPCCGPCTGRICVTVQATGCAIPIAGVTVTITDDASPPNIIDTPVTVGVIASIAAGSSGSGYTNGTGYPLGISGDGTGATGTFDVVGGHVTNIVITDGGSNYSTATITFPGAGGSGATATATIKGKVCTALPSAGTYHVTAHIPGATDVTTTVNAVCGVDNNVTLTYPTGSIGKVCFDCKECDCVGNVRIDPNVTFTGGTPAIGTPPVGYTDPVTGLKCFLLGAGGGYGWMATFPSGFSESGTSGVPACGTATITIQSVKGLVMNVNRAGGGLPGFDACTITLTFPAPGQPAVISGVCVLTFAAGETDKDCCVEFAPIRALSDFFTYRYQSSGGKWDNTSFGTVSCYPASSPYVIGLPGC